MYWQTTLILLVRLTFNTNIYYQLVSALMYKELIWCSVRAICTKTPSFLRSERKEAKVRRRSFAETMTKSEDTMPKEQRHDTRYCRSFVFKTLPLRSLVLSFFRVHFDNANIALKEHNKHELAFKFRRHQSEIH